MAACYKILVMYPLDVVKTRIQIQTGKGAAGEGYNGMLDCFRKIIAQEGYGSFDKRSCSATRLTRHTVSQDCTAVSMRPSSWKRPSGMFQTERHSLTQALTRP